MKTFQIHCERTQVCTYTLEAESEESARQDAEDFLWDGPDGEFTVINWDVNVQEVILPNACV